MIEDEHGVKIQEQDKRLMEWSKYFERLYNQEFETDETAITLNSNINDTINDNPPTKEEIKKAFFESRTFCNNNLYGPRYYYNYKCMTRQNNGKDVESGRRNHY